jgi:hypothetical protein
LAVIVSFATGPSDSIDHGLTAAAYCCDAAVVNHFVAVALSFSN